MKNKSLSFIIGFLLITTTFSCMLNPCPSAEKMQESMTKLVVEANQTAEKQERANWQMLDSRFDHLISECYDQYKDELTLEDKKSFWLNGIRYYKYRYGTRWYEKLDDPNDPLAQRLEQEIGDTLESSAENVLQFVKEVYGDELKEGIDEVVKEIEKLGEELKNILSN